jgi:hypothetical protein
VCGISSLIDGTVLFAVFFTFYIPFWRWYALINLPLASSVLIVLPILAIIFGAIPLKQGKGTDWDGKDMAKTGLVAGIISVAWMIFSVSLHGIFGVNVIILLCFLRYIL